MASTSNLSTDIAVVQDYYEKMSLREREFKNPLLRLAQKGVIPKNYKDVIHFHRWNKFGLAEDVNEGVDPVTGVSADVTEIKVELTEFAKHISIPRYGDAQRFSSLIEESYPKFIEQAERTANRKLITAIAAGSSAGNNSFSAATKMYANSKESFADLAAGDTLTNKDIQRAVSFLEKQGWPGPYYVVTNPWGKEDLMVDDDDFRQFVKYGGLDNMKSGEIKTWAGANVEILHEPFRETLGGTEGTYVGSGRVITTYVFGKDAYGTVTFGGQNGVRPKFKVQDISTTGANITIGYRMPFAGLVLQPLGIVQLKSVARDGSVASES